MHIVPGLEEVLSQLISFTEETTVSVNMYNTVRFTLSKNNSIYCGDVFVATRTHIANENVTFCILRFDVRNELVNCSGVDTVSQEQRNTGLNTFDTARTGWSAAGSLAEQSAIARLTTATVYQR